MPPVDTSVPEWRIITALLPALLQTSLHWRIKEDSSSRSWSKLHSWFQWIRPQRPGIIAEPVPDSEDSPILKQLRTRMRQLIDSQPLGELQVHDILDCRIALSEVLLALGAFVDDSVSEGTRGSPQEDESQFELYRPSLRAPQLPVQVPTIQADTQCSWPSGVDTDLGLSQTPRTTLAASGSASLQQRAPKEPPAAIPGIPYRKLQSAINVFENDRRRFSTFVRLDHSVEEYEDLFNKLTEAKDCLKNAMGDDLPQYKSGTELQQEFPVTNWEDATPWIAFCQLLLNISLTTCSGHEARVHLNGFSLGSQDELISVKVFVSSCPPTLSASWIELRCKYFIRLVCLALHNTHSLPPTDDVVRGYAAPDDMTLVEDLCPLHSGEARVSVPNVIDMEHFGKGHFYKLSNTHPTRHSATPTVSLAYLLENGFLKMPFNGGAFNLLDKAALALSLSLCLLHYFQGHLMENTWSADNIHFLHQYKESEQWLLNIYHPYITCCITKEAQDLLGRIKGDSKQPQSDSLHDILVDPAVCRVCFRSFARLLLEIEMGQRITLSDPLADAGDVELEAINKKMPGNRLLYHQAVRGCIRFTEYLRHTKRTDPTLYNVRRVLYKEVVRPLEQHIQFFNDPSVYKKQREVQLKRSSGSMNSFSNRCSVILYRQGAASQVAREALLDTAADANCITENLCTILKCARSSYTGRPFIQADERIIVPKEKVVVEFSLGEVGRRQKGQFLVVEKLAGVDIILGKPFFEQSRIIQFTSDYL